MAAARLEPRPRRSEATRARLVAAAAEALLAGGGDFEMSQVARRADVSDGLPYHYFGSKAGALSAVVDDFYDRYYAVVNQPLDGSRPWAEREFGRRDPQPFVMDEVAGQWVALLALPPSGISPIWFAAGGWFLFRVFDVLKPFPIRKLERLPAGWGIVTDDLMAGVYACVALQVLFRIVLTTLK